MNEWRTRMYARSEGANIRTWIGFKTLLALVEEGVLSWLRAQGVGPRALFHERGLELDIADLSALLITVVELDEPVDVAVTPIADGHVQVRLLVQRAGEELTAARAKVRLRIRAAHADNTDLPAVIAGFARVLEPSTHADVPAARWSWQARYYHCQYSRYVRHSRYVDLLEDVVDRFLDEHGLGIGALLRERAWIPVVSRVRVGVHADVALDETVHTSLAVTDVIKDRAWEAHMHCWVVREGRAVICATAQILHGYAVAHGPAAGTVAPLDRATIAALRGTSS